MAQRAATSKMQIAVLFILPIFLLMMFIPQQMISVFTHKGVYDHNLIVQMKDSHGQMVDALNPSYMDKLGGDYVRIAAIS